MKTILISGAIKKAHMSPVWPMDHTLPTPNLENEEQIEFKPRTREEIINIRAQVNKV